MIFMFLMPVFAGLGNFVIPLMLGAHDMAFPRLNALVVLDAARRGGLMLPVAVLRSAVRRRLDGLPAALEQGRHGRDALRRSASSSPAPSSIATAVNFLVTIMTMRAPGMTLWRMPLLVWANLDDLGAGRARHAVHRRRRSS